MELAVMVLGWMVLEYVWHKLFLYHVGFFCDNTSAVAWAYKGITSTSLLTGRLLRLLSIRKQYRQTSLLVPQHIAGNDNNMADITSRYFKQGGFFYAQSDLENYFNLHFPLPHTN